MSEYARQEAERHKQDAERLRQQAELLEKDPELQEEWILQDNLTYGGLMAVGVIMVQPFLAADSLDRSATTCVVSWPVAIPLLAALLLVNRQETFRRRRTGSRTVGGARAVALLAAFVGLVAAIGSIALRMARMEPSERRIAISALAPLGVDRRGSYSTSRWALTALRAC